MTFHDDAVFPAQIAVGSSVGAGFLVDVVTNANGTETRTLRSEIVRHTADVSTGIKDPTQLFAVQKFFLARQGATHGFRFKMPFDFTSSFEDPCLAGFEVMADDQVIATGDGSTTTFQLIKTYDDPTQNYTRKITRPIDGTVKVSVNGIELTTGWTVNKATGIVTFAVAPALGAVVAAGYEFHTPMRFETDSSEAFEVNTLDFKYGSIPRIGLIELLDDQQVESTAYYGGAYEVDLANGPTTISPLNGRVISVQPGTTAGENLLLPSLDNLEPGGPYFYIHHYTTAALSFDIADESGTLIQTVATGESYMMVIGLTSAGVKYWLAHKG